MQSSSYARRLRVEQLEDRRLLAPVTVGNNLDVVNGDTSSIAALQANHGGDGISLREAIAAANNTSGGDMVLFDAALSGQTITFSNITGGFEVTEALAIDATALESKPTIRGGNQRIFNITAASGAFSIAGLILTGGETNGDGVSSGGGAVRSNSTGTLTLQAMEITSSRTTGLSAHGGAVYARGSLDLTDSTVSENFTTGENAKGGALFTGGNITITNSSVLDSAAAGRNARGGNVFAEGHVTLNNSTVDGGATVDFRGVGGGIAAEGDVTLIQSTVSNNVTLAAAALGAGIWSRGNVSLVESTVSGNQTLQFGPNDPDGGVAGAGIRAYGNVTVTNSTITNNTTNGPLGYGAGIAANGMVSVTASTITNNQALHADASAGGIWLNPALGGDLEITGSIVAGNTAGAGNDDLSPSSGSLTVSHSLIGDNTGTSLIEAQTADANGNLIGSAAGAGVIEPLLAPLADNGGPTQSRLPMLGSPAIDAGDPSLAPGAFDQRGAPFTRLFDGDDDGSTRTDIGAVELHSLVVDTVVDESDGDLSAGNYSLREAINLAAAIPGNNTILFDSSLSGRSILLDGAAVEIFEPLAIDATALAGGVTLDAQQQSRVLNITTSTGDVTLTGLTITGGRTTGDNVNSLDHTYSGGGIRSLTDGTLTLDRTTVTGNTTTGNQADGGGIDAVGPVVLIDSEVADNSILGTGFGGGVHSDDDITLTRSLLSGNSTLSNGGGLWTQDYARLFQSTVSENVASEGGGIRSGFVTLVESTLSDNVAAGRGGGMFSIFSATLARSTVSGNTSSDRGAGLWAGRLLQVIDSTVTDNHSTDLFYASGGGIYFFPNVSFVEFTIVGSIVAGNTSSTGSSPDIGLESEAVTINSSLIGVADGLSLPGNGGNQSGTADNPLDPMLGPLANNGGPTKTHALLPSSPAIDAISPLVTPTSVTSSTAASDFFPVANLINGSGLVTPLTFNNYASEEHAFVNGSNAWVTATAGGAVDYYSTRPAPELVFSLGAQTLLTHMAVWGYAGAGGPNNNEAKTFEVSFSTDGGASYSSPVVVNHVRTGTSVETISLSGEYLADTVRVRITDNHFGTPGAPGGDRVGLGEVRFLTTTSVFDQRGFSRFADGDGIGGTQRDVGAYEAQGPVTAAPGDYNRDGMVGAADYTLWRDNLGASVPPLSGADGDGNGVVDIVDYRVWKSHFGFTYTLPAAVEAALATSSQVALSTKSEEDSRSGTEAAFAFYETPEGGTATLRSTETTATTAVGPSIDDGHLLLLGTVDDERHGESQVISLRPIDDEASVSSLDELLLELAFSEWE